MKIEMNKRKNNTYLNYPKNNDYEERPSSETGNRVIGNSILNINQLQNNNNKSNFLNVYEKNKSN